MAKIGKKPTDDQLLEGGGRGAGGASTLEAATKIGGPATLAFLGGIGGSEILKNAREKKEAADEIKRESRGSQDSMTTGEKEALQEVQDEKMRQKMKTAPTTKTEMGKPFAGGGMTASSRGDGIAQRGKTKGTIVMCGGGYAKGKK